MANEEHLEILYQGVNAWNQWRKENPDIRPNLSKAILNRADLSGAILTRADLSGASLTWANLSAATLSGVDLNGADLNRAILSATNLNKADLTGASLFDTDLLVAILHEANLYQADLTGASLFGTNLSGANLREVDLNRVTLSGTNLNGADLTRAVLNFTSFDGVDLSQAKGLENVRHNANSYIDIHTIYRSKGNIPEIFLRGAGVPDVFIEYMRSLVGRPIEYYSCFISYSNKDQVLAERLHADLQNNGVRCWYAPHDLRIGSKYESGIDEAIRFHDKLLLILSENAIESGWVEHEVEKALEKERESGEFGLFPIRIDDTVMEVDSGWAGHIRKERHIGDFRDWKSHDAYQKVFQQLLRDLKTDQRAPTPAAVFTTPHNTQETAELDPQRTWLLDLIAEHFSGEELRTLCFQLSVDFDDLPGETKSGKIRELILYFERQRPGGAGTLAEYVRDKRPNAFD